MKNAAVVKGIESVVPCCILERAHQWGKVRPKSLQPFPIQQSPPNIVLGVVFELAFPFVDIGVED
jgi:hypothetical protein